MTIPITIVYVLMGYLMFRWETRTYPPVTEKDGESYMGAGQGTILDKGTPLAAGLLLFVVLWPFFLCCHSLFWVSNTALPKPKKPKHILTESEQEVETMLKGDTNE